LESGTTAIASGAFLAMALISGRVEAVLLSAALIGSCLGFLWYNRYPARAFPGDVGTLTMGGALALAALLARAEVLLPLILAPHIVELFCKISNRFSPKEITGHARLGQDGKLVPGAYRAFVHLMMLRFPSDEKTLVARVWATEALLSVLSVLIYLLVLLPMEA
jgi:UDP-N-acetylglucosamine--dolichyl-phosphate N-acetylglucosaminephosphotransferase